jgi:hypothetical protein
MIGDQLLTIEVGTETGKAYMRNTDTFADICTLLAIKILHPL